jgi:hypothetical protein
VPAPTAVAAGASPATPPPLVRVQRRATGAPEAPLRATAWLAPPALAVQAGSGVALAAAEPLPGATAPAWVSVLDLAPAPAAAAPAPTVV